MTSDILFELSHVSKKFTKGQELISIFDDLNLTLNRGEFISIMGPSGSGKTTLLNMLGGIDRATAGDIKFVDQTISSFSEGQLAAWRADHVGFIFQSYNLMPMLSAARNVELPLLLKKMTKSERKKRVDAALALVKLSDRAKHLPREMSGGQQQRVAIARAVVTDPDLLLCDEPTGDLDRATATQVLEMLRELNEEFNKTIIMVTHDPEASKYASHQLHLDKGQFDSQEV